MMNWEHAGSVAIVALLTAAFTATVVSQIARVLTVDPLYPPRTQPAPLWLRLLWAPVRWDRIGVIPQWMFFSTPPVYNIRLLTRERLCSGDFSPWRTVPFVCDERIKSVWNPDRQRHKAMQDFAHTLIRVIQNQERPETGDPLNHIAFHGLATYCRSLPRSPLSIDRQFLLARCYIVDRRPPEVVFVSPLLGF